MTTVIIDKNIPKIFKIKLKKNLKNFNLVFMPFNANEKSKSIKTVNYYLEKLLLHNFNRSDLVISVGGGITGDVVGFVASIYLISCYLSGILKIKNFKTN